MQDFVSLLSRYRTYIMGVAMICIMLFHQGWITQPLGLFQLYGCHGVDIFFFVSGFGVYFSLQKHTLWDFYKRRIKRLLPLCIFCGGLKLGLFLTGYDIFYSEDMSILTLFGIDLWFLFDIWIFYLLSPLLLGLLKKHGIIVMLCSFFIAIGGSVFMETPTFFRFGIVRIPVFLLGMMVAGGKLKISSRELSGGAIFVLLAFGYKILSMEYHFLIETYRYLFFCGGACFVCYVLFHTAPFLQRIKAMKALEFVGRHSLELYLWHEYIYNCIYHLKLSPYLSFLVAFSLSIIIAYCSSKIIKLVRL